MPGKNKPKRLNRQRSWRVMRRKKRIDKLVTGNSRNRKPRPKNKGRVAEKVVETVKKVVARKSVPSKLGTKVPSSSGKKVVKKEE
jgi:hypothetical protein